MTLLEQCLGALALAGDLSMGQPSDHSPATAVLAARIAREAGASEETAARSARLALIRWSGCTANAREFADLLGDDVRGRAALIADRNPFVAKDPPSTSIHGVIRPLADMHCETAIEIARRAGLGEGLIRAIDDLFENWDGSGLPRGRSGEDIDSCAQFVALASDLEVFSRSYGPARASVLIESRGGRVYEPRLASRVGRDGQGWLSALAETDLLRSAIETCRLGAVTAPFSRLALVHLLADFADLKRPERTGGARACARLARRVAARLGLDEAVDRTVGEAAMLCRIGTVAIANTAFAADSRTDAEALRLAPYWTERILSRARDLGETACIASMAFERLDGSGYHRGLSSTMLPVEARIVQVAAAVTDATFAGAETALTGSAVADGLEIDVRAGRLDPAVVEATLRVLGSDRVPPTMATAAMPRITERERNVLTFLIKGMTNKEIARQLDLSPKTVGTHLENAYRKLGVSTRAGAAMRALELGAFGA